MFLRFAALLLLVFGLSNIGYAAESGWKSVSSLGGYARQLRSSGEMPASIQCRNGSASGSAFKPEFSVSTVANTNKLNWVIFAANGAYQPGRPGEKGWSKASGNVITTPGSGQKIHCALYRMNAPGSFSAKAPSIWIKTGSGIRILN